MSLNLINQAEDLRGKRILVRVDWNVPLAEGRVSDDSRIKSSLETLEFLRNHGSRIIILSHFDPDNASLEPVYEYAKGIFSLSFCKSINIEDIRSAAAALKEGEALLLENTRLHQGETTNDAGLAKQFASLGDIYVNEAFSASHRMHASISALAELLPSYIGSQFDKEMKNLSRALYPDHPFLFILGGAKFETKIPLVDKFLNIADKIAIFGANAKPAHEKYANNPKVIFPMGDIGALDFADDANQNLLRENIINSKFILWNGPLGKYEDGYKEGTQNLARTLAESGKEVIVGGADTLASIKELNIENKFAFVSTAGGAMLDFLATGTLPGIEALKKSPN